MRGWGKTGGTEFYDSESGGSGVGGGRDGEDSECRGERKERRVEEGVGE